MGGASSVLRQAYKLLQPLSNTSLVFIELGNLLDDQVVEEYKDLVDKKWDRQVWQLSSTDYALVFPSKESLRMATRGGRLMLLVGKCLV
jgi:hypothetical protein